MGELIKTKQRRGCLTDRIKEVSLKLMGYEINVHELRLMFYIMYLVIHTQKIGRLKIDRDKNILAKWEEKGYFTTRYSKIIIAKEFWNIICEIVWLGYVDLK